MESAIIIAERTLAFNPMGRAHPEVFLELREILKTIRDRFGT